MGKECTTGCNKDWLKYALEVLKQNNELWKNFHVKVT